MALNPLDTTTDPQAAILSRLARLEERTESLERGRISQIMYRSGVITAPFDPEERNAKGTIIAELLTDPSLPGELFRLISVLTDEGYYSF